MTTVSSPNDDLSRLVQHWKRFSDPKKSRANLPNLLINHVPHSSATTSGRLLGKLPGPKPEQVVEEQPCAPYHRNIYIFWKIGLVMIIYDLIRQGTSPGAQETSRDSMPRGAGTINEIVMGGILGCWKSFERIRLC